MKIRDDLGSLGDGDVVVVAQFVAAHCQRDGIPVAHASRLRHVLLYYIHTAVADSDIE
jgi:hypothetical protein